jgi:hypothetical protein
VPAARVALYDPTARTSSALGSGLTDGAVGASMALAQSDASGLWGGRLVPSAGRRPSADVALWTGTRADVG